MTYISYKALVAKRLAVDPNELLIYFEHNGFAIATTPDGVQHAFTYAELDRPAAKKTDPGSHDHSIPVANSENLGVDPAAPAAGMPTKPTKKVAESDLISEISSPIPPGQTITNTTTDKTTKTPTKKVAKRK